MRNP